MISEQLTAKINEHYAKNTTKCVFSRIRRVFKLMEINNLQDMTRNKGKDLLEAIKDIPGNSTLLHCMIKVCRLDDIEVPGCWCTEGKKMGMKQKKDAHIKKRNTEYNNDLDIVKIKEYFVEKNKEGTWCKKKQMRSTLFAILNRCPLRLTTIAKLQWEDNNKNNYIDLSKEHPEIVIRESKNSKKVQDMRRLPIDKDLRKLLKRHKRKIESEYVFPNKHDTATDTGCMEAIYRNAIKLYCKENEIEYKQKEMGIHMLRSMQASKDMKGKIDLRINCSEDELRTIIDNCKERGHSLFTALQYYALKE